MADTPAMISECFGAIQVNLNKRNISATLITKSMFDNEVPIMTQLLYSHHFLSKWCENQINSSYI